MGFNSGFKGLNVLCSACLFSFLFQYVPVLYSTTEFWCLLALHVLFLPCSSAGLRLVTHLIVLFGSIYLLIIHCTLFPFSFSHFVQADVFLCLATTPVRISFLTERLSSKLHLLPHSPPSQIRASTLLAGTTLLRTYHRPHSSLYKICIGTAGFLFGFLTKEAAADRLSRNVSKLLLLAA